MNDEKTKEVPGPVEVWKDRGERLRVIKTPRGGVIVETPERDALGAPKWERVARDMRSSFSDDDEKLVTTALAKGIVEKAEALAIVEQEFAAASARDREEIARLRETITKGRLFAPTDAARAAASEKLNAARDARASLLAAEADLREARAGSSQADVRSKTDAAVAHLPILIGVLSALLGEKEGGA